MIDLHTHIIPGVDDGSQSMEMTLSMMLSACDQGVRGFFATPHSSAFDTDPDGVQEAFRSLRSTAKRYFPGVSVYSGCEVYCDSFQMDDTLSALRTGRYPTMNGTSYVLTEFSQWVAAESTLPCMEKLVDAGWKPIIAHAERYCYLRNNHELVDQFRALGCLIQINVYSVFEEMDQSIVSWARSLVRHQKADFLGSDMHRTYHRPPSVETGLRWLYENCCKDYVDAIAFGNAQKLLLNQQ